MILVGVLRHQVTLLIGGEPAKPTAKAVRERQVAVTTAVYTALARGTVLRASGNHISAASFAQRKAYLCKSYEDGAYLKNPGAATGAPNPMSDPAGMEMMMDGMKKNMAMIVPQTVIMGWVNFFFSGFVLIKLPFPLTLRFKSMLQRGVDTSEMDVAWVSSLSWYFLNLFGLRSIFNIILGEDNVADGMRDMQAMGGMGMAPTGQPQDFNKLFLAEKENLELTVHRWELDDVEKRVLKKYRR
ncbi:integral membrane protein DUF106-domain-containing protein [Thamnocephalis sphaerospora]|uniref:ER membrane protein complex subunit 3 n=1 Tax=Thamnocephalis sphaerospora TaxID=78915 RepID=A0A4P9XRE3_9FUNG|nr:integral membrane protein DUF106-domain-containing protein [Thamnocephalis sphaerospora]|eukprot:RKP08653.1 integral membrane protein DUF106-domain-containing protein [Thamnocephalis sphaerospora]